MRKISRILLLSAVAGIAITGCRGGAEEKSHIEKGMAYIDALAYEEAMNEFSKAEKAEESPELIYRGEGIAFLAQCEYEKAAESFSEALRQSDGRIDDTEKDISYYLALAEFKSGDAEGAIETYSRIIDFDGDEKDAYYLRGTVYLAEDELKKAQADFKKAAGLADRDYDLYILIGQNLLDRGYETEGGEYLEKAAGIKGSRETDYYVRGRAYYYIGNNDKALKELKKANEEGSMEALLFLGMTYEKLEDMDSAIESYEKYLKEDSTSGNAYNRIGLCRMAEKDFAGALESIQKGIETGDADAMEELLYNEIAAYEYMGDFSTAREKMASYIGNYPGNEKAAREYEFLKTR